MELSTQCLIRSLRPRRRTGFAADLSLGFYLYAPERLTYVWAGTRDRFQWRTHRFVAFDGRLVRIDLPPSVTLFIWPAGRGPMPSDSVADKSSIWARVPPHSLHGEEPCVLNRLFRLWKEFSRPPVATRASAEAGH